MELVARKADLVRELQFFQQIVERKNTIPILANVLLDAGKNHLALLATDLDVGLRSRCDATVVKGGTLTMPAKKLFEILQHGRNFDGGVILLSPDDVRAAAKLLKTIADQHDPDEADEMDEGFVEELVRPFATTAKKDRAVFGQWG